MAQMRVALAGEQALAQQHLRARTSPRPLAVRRACVVSSSQTWLASSSSSTRSDPIAERRVPAPLAVSTSRKSIGERRNARTSAAFTYSDRAKGASEPDMLTPRNYDPPNCAGALPRLAAEASAMPRVCDRDRAASFSRCSGDRLHGPIARRSWALVRGFVDGIQHNVPLVGRLDLVANGQVDHVQDARLTDQQRAAAADDRVDALALYEFLLVAIQVVAGPEQESEVQLTLGFTVVASAVLGDCGRCSLKIAGFHVEGGHVVEWALLGDVLPLSDQVATHCHVLRGVCIDRHLLPADLHGLWRDRLLAWSAGFAIAAGARPEQGKAKASPVSIAARRTIDLYGGTPFVLCLAGRPLLCCRRSLPAAGRTSA